MAFLIPILELILKREDPLSIHQIGALVITPTRELSTQISQLLPIFMAHVNSSPSIMKLYPKGISFGLFIGGIQTVQQDMMNFKSRGSHIMIGTPGRLQHLINRLQGVLSLKELEVLVLDEGDRLLELGFLGTLRGIMSNLPKLRRTGLFSATMTDGLKDLISAGLRNPVRVIVKVKNKQSESDPSTSLVSPSCILPSTSSSFSSLPLSAASSNSLSQLNYQDSNQRIPSSLSIYYVIAKQEEKIPMMMAYLQHNLDKKVMVYLSTCAAVDFVFKVKGGLFFF